MSDPLDVSAVRADDQLIEDLRAGRDRTGDEVERSLTDMRDHAIGGRR